jgi:hypothetical protein
MTILLTIDLENIVGTHEIADRLNLSFPNVVHTWRTRHKDFPQPFHILKAGMLWDWKEVEAWAIKTKRIKQ